MLDSTDAVPTRKKRGPKTPEGKARSARNALKHGLRARRFVLPPGEDPAAFDSFVEGIRQAYGPEDGAEAELVDAIAAGLWQAMRADRLEAELLAAIPPAHEGHSHGSAMIDKPEHRASLATVLRYQTTAGNAVRRAMDGFLKHRKAKRKGLIVEAADGSTRHPHSYPVPQAGGGTGATGRTTEIACVDPLTLAEEGSMRVTPANDNKPVPDCTNEFPVPTAATAKPVLQPDPNKPDTRLAPDCTNEFSARTDATAEPASRPEPKEPDSPSVRNRTNEFLAASGSSSAVPSAPAKSQIAWPDDAPPDLFPPDTPSHVQAFLLGLLDSKSQEEREQFYALRSIEAFEAWEAKQPEPEPCDVSEEELALVRWATRHNPPWCYGPQPGEAIERPACLGPEPVLPAPNVRPDPHEMEAQLRARLVSLLDRSVPKDLSDLDLAHAVCAVLWPKYPEYRGTIDLFMLRRVLQEVRVDGRALQWLDSHELARLCAEGEARKAAGTDG